jgi:sec-independent protein translocase protein TatA
MARVWPIARPQRHEREDRYKMLAYSPGPEWIVVLVVLVLLFGAKKLPELARSVGKSTSEFKKGMSEGPSDEDAAGTADDVEERAQRKAETSD